MILPRGITGFRSSGEAPLPLCNFQQFSDCCWSAVRSAGGKIRSVREWGIQRNYAIADIELLDDVLALLNAYFPLVAFAKRKRYSQLELEFVDCADLAASFESQGHYRILDAELLNGVPTTESLSELSPAELKQIKYHQPNHLGDIVFNSWD